MSPITDLIYRINLCIGRTFFLQILSQSQVRLIHVWKCLQIERKWSRTPIFPTSCFWLCNGEMGGSYTCYCGFFPNNFLQFRGYVLYTCATYMRPGVYGTSSLFTIRSSAIFIFATVCLFWRYLTRELIWHKSIFHKALKDDIIAFWYLRKSQCFPFNVEC